MEQVNHGTFDQKENSGKAVEGRNDRSKKSVEGHNPRRGQTGRTADDRSTSSKSSGNRGPKRGSTGIGKGKRR